MSWKTSRQRQREESSSQVKTLPVLGGSLAMYNSGIECIRKYPVLVVYFKT